MKELVLGVLPLNITAYILLSRSLKLVHQNDLEYMKPVDLSTSSNFEMLLASLWRDSKVVHYVHRQSEMCLYLTLAMNSFIKVAPKISRIAVLRKKQ